MVTCPSCNGAGGGHGFMCPGGCGWITCTICKGAKEITEECAERYAEGARMRRDRQGRRVTLRQEAARLGCDLGEWSRIEHGWEAETEAGKAALEKRRKEIESAYGVLTGGGNVESV